MEKVAFTIFLANNTSCVISLIVNGNISSPPYLKRSPFFLPSLFTLANDLHKGRDSRAQGLILYFLLHFYFDLLYIYPDHDQAPDMRDGPEGRPLVQIGR